MTNLPSYSQGSWHSGFYLVCTKHQRIGLFFSPIKTSKGNGLQILRFSFLSYHNTKQQRLAPTVQVIKDATPQVLMIKEGKSVLLFYQRKHLTNFPGDRQRNQKNLNQQLLTSLKLGKIHLYAKELNSSKIHRMFVVICPFPYHQSMLFQCYYFQVSEVQSNSPFSPAMHRDRGKPFDSTQIKQQKKVINFLSKKHFCLFISCLL